MLSWLGPSHYHLFRMSNELEIWTYKVTLIHLLNQGSHTGLNSEGLISLRSHVLHTQAWESEET